DIELALGGLVATVSEPEERALLAVELARMVRGSIRAPSDPERVRAAAEVLQKALPQAAEEPVLAELDRLSLVVEGTDLRSRVLDVFDSRFAREGAPVRMDPAFVVAMYREKARLLQKRGAREAALAVLERALRTQPGHPLLIADFLDA